MTGAAPRSAADFRRARQFLAGGVNSPVRAFGAVGGHPVFFRQGEGPYLTDVDGRRFIDLVGSWGAAILGHAPPAVVRAVRAAAGRGLSFGAPTESETRLAERIRSRAPTLQRMRFVNSGTEAVMSAIRLARGHTGRSKIVKFAGGYHGHSDGLLAQAGSGPAAAGLPDSAGVPASITAQTVVVAYNDPEALRETFEVAGSEIAAVVVEPIAANMSLVPPRPGFLREVGRSAHAHGALVIADEVITGFRLGPGLAHAQLGLSADLVTLGKIVGGGLPVGVYGGRREIFADLAPDGAVYQAGTLSGNPLTVAAGLATLRELTPRLYARLERRSAELERRLRDRIGARALRGISLTRVGSMFGVTFTEQPPTDYAAAKRSDRGRYARFFHAALASGVYLPPSPLETFFLSTAHGPPQVEQVATALADACAAAVSPRSNR